MWPFNKEQRVEKLIARAEDEFESYQFEDVLPIAEKLLALGHTSGFEWKARALYELGRLPEAIALLEEGVRCAPQVPDLWSYLGDYCSEAGDFAGAHAGFARLEAFPEPWHSNAIANDALVLQREGRLEDALVRLDQVGTPTDFALQRFVAGVRVSILTEMRRWDDVIRIGEPAIDWIRATEEANADAAESSGGSLGRIQADVGEAHWRGRNDAETALEFCFEATRSHRGDDVLALIREIENHDARNARPYRIMCRGTAMMVFMETEVTGSRPRRHGYLVTYCVLADTPEEALGFARRFEARDLGDDLISFELSEAEVLSAAVVGCKGVYAARLGRTIFLDEEGDE